MGRGGINNPLKTFKESRFEKKQEKRREIINQLVERYSEINSPQEILTALMGYDKFWIQETGKLNSTPRDKKLVNQEIDGYSQVIKERVAANKRVTELDHQIYLQLNQYNNFQNTDFNKVLAYPVKKIPEQVVSHHLLHGGVPGKQQETIEVISQDLSKEDLQHGYTKAVLLAAANQRELNYKDAFQYALDYRLSLLDAQYAVQVIENPEGNDSQALNYSLANVLSLGKNKESRDTFQESWDKDKISAAIQNSSPQILQLFGLKKSEVEKAFNTMLDKETAQARL